MGEQPETTAPVGSKHSFYWRLFILWPFVILLLYFLSFGPFWLILEKGRINAANQFEPVNQFVLEFYGPLQWAYDETPLHRPLGMYLHLWASSLFDKNGDFTPHK